MADTKPGPWVWHALPPRDRREAATDVARYALNRILLGDPEPKRLAEKALADMAELLKDGDR